MINSTITISNSYSPRILFCASTDDEINKILASCYAKEEMIDDFKKISRQNKRN